MPRVAVQWMAAACAGAASGLALAGPAGAESVPPSQAIADHGVFLEHVAPPAQPAAVCIVDSGVDLNPDTAGQVVYREALDGGDPGDVSPDKHGTLMAMMAAAPVNGWGMVGAAPGAVKIVSVRVEEAGEGAFPFSDYERGITACKKLAAEYSIKVISLSLSGSQPPEENDNALLENAVGGANAYGIDVLAAAGNDGGPVSAPASYPRVVAVGASSPEGSLCAFSNRGAELHVAAPGCMLDGADPTAGDATTGTQQGTSEATAIAAAVLADLRGYHPDMGVDQSERLIEQSSAPTLNVQRVFASAGLRAEVDTGTPHSAPLQSNQDLPVPRVVVRSRDHHLLVRLLNLPTGAHCRLTELRKEFGEFGRRPTVVGQTTTSQPTTRIPRVDPVNTLVAVFLRGDLRSPATSVQLSRHRK